MGNLLQGVSYAAIITALTLPLLWLGMKIFALEGKFLPLIPIIFVSAIYDYIFCAGWILGIGAVCLFAAKLCELDFLDALYMGLFVFACKAIIFLAFLQWIIDPM